MGEEILSAVTTEDGLDILAKYGKAEKTISRLMEKIEYYLEKRAGCDIGAFVFRQNGGLIGKTSRADDLAQLIGGER